MKSILEDKTEEKKRKKANADHKQIHGRISTFHIVLNHKL
jgi:hypothetical protein